MYSLKSIKNQLFKQPTSMVHLENSSIVEKFISNPDFPFLISFPRTGSHWLRILMELYFKKPSLKRVFYYDNANDFTCYHTHALTEDYEILNIKRKRFIYLYRNAPETIFSQLKYMDLDINDINNITVWSKKYADHLNIWLLHQNPSCERINIKYDTMQIDIQNQFDKICTFMGESFDQKHFESILSKVSKENIKSKTKHDKQVINMSSNYNSERNDFLKNHENKIWDILWDKNENLKEFFN